MNRILRMRRSISILALAVGIVGGALIVHHKFLAWKRFAIVEPGVLYRSGGLHDWQLRRAIDKYKIKTVFSFTHTDTEREQLTCDELGVRRYFCYLPGDGVGTDDPYLRFLEVMRDERNHPVLVHCSAGVQRTGGAVALYRAVFQRWEFDQAIAEMIAMGNEGLKTQIDQLRRIDQKLPRVITLRLADESDRGATNNK